MALFKFWPIQLAPLCSEWYSLCPFADILDYRELNIGGYYQVDIYDVTMLTMLVSHYLFAEFDS